MLNENEKVRRRINNTHWKYKYNFMQYCQKNITNIFVNNIIFNISLHFVSFLSLKSIIEKQTETLYSFGLLIRQEVLECELY